MSTEWKELKIDKLPEDILTGNYEMEWIDNDGNWVKSMPATKLTPLQNILLSGFRYRYRTPEPLPPTHEARVKSSLHRLKGVQSDPNHSQVVDFLLSSVILLLESADMPPEGACDE